MDALGDDYEAVIGLEIHCQLDTDSKLFSRSSVDFGGPPNSRVAPVDAGLPGALPTPNRRAVEFACRVALALDGDVRRRSTFARKNYFYPDLPKGYQITQYRDPLCESGELTFAVDGRERTVGIERLHLEEDAGKSTHRDDPPRTLVDLNRSGVPLIEIVTEPELRTPAEARSFMKRLRNLVVWLGVSDGDMSEGSLRCDANVSVRPAGATTFGTRTELKNINSFKFVHDGLAAEIDRQVGLLRAGESIDQETRLYDREADETVPMRTKEESHDYRYFPEPDLPPLIVDETWLESIRASMPELPRETRRRFREDHDVDEEALDVFATNRSFAELFDAAVEACDAPGADLAKWLTNDFARVRNERGFALDAFAPGELADLFELIADGRIARNDTGEVLEAMVETGDDPETIVERRGLEQLSDRDALAEVVEEVVEANPDQVATYRDGKDQVLGWFIGQVMQATGGDADAKVARELLQERLDGE